MFKDTIASLTSEFSKTRDKLLALSAKHADEAAVHATTIVDTQVKLDAAKAASQQAAKIAANISSIID